MKNIKWKSVLMYLPSVVLMIVIFLFSSKPAEESSAESSRIVNLVLHAVEYLRQTKFTVQEFSYWAEMIHTPIRKMAHMTEYAVLSLTFFLPAFFQDGAVAREKEQSGNMDGGERKQEKKVLWKLCLRSILFSMLYASTDEFHQLFVEGRSGSVRDVMIDTLGATLGILFFLCLWKIITFLTLSKKSSAS
jgi:VanZ family protein